MPAIEDFVLNNFDPKQSLYIEASAGTGKTFTIKQIVRRLVVDEHTPLEKILIVTYTEKAAGELKDRIRDILKDHPEIDVDNASIFTIHSFCQKILGEYSFTAGLPMSLELADESEIAAFIDRWIRDDLADKADLKLLLDNSDDGVSKLTEKLKKDFCAAVKAYYLNKEYTEDGGIVSRNHFFKDNRTYDELKMVYDSGKERDRGKIFSTDAKRKEFLYCYFLYKYLPELYKEWQNEKSQLKVQTYDDMIRNVREAVFDGSPLQKVLRDIFTFAIIDEFQDTNQKQWDIFSKVFLNCPGHSIFVVGDPKQSIYAFQGADVNVYTKAKEQIGNGRCLKKNYRSTDNLVNACNKLFGSGSFFADNKNIDFEKSETCEEIENPTFKNEPAKVLWISNENINEWGFAALAVQKIVECCKKDENGNTNLRIFEKDAGMRNVTFKDFAILARTKTEMVPFEKTMAEYGVPYSRYKDPNLFEGRECAQWISLFSAIDSEDYSSSRRRILSEVLFTDFFGIRMNQVESHYFDNPGCPQRQTLLNWKHIAQNHNWANLIEAVFRDTEIETRMSSLDKLQSLSKLRQIANYSADYLYKNNCSISELIKQLKKLHEDDSMNDDNIIARGTDFDCVQVMTIHASKGLDFPVVIGAGGYKGYNNKIPAAYVYHDETCHEKLGFSKDEKTEQKEEQLQEWKRLFYVAYTRATSLMILPRYEVWNKGDYSFLENSLKKLYENKDEYILDILPDPDFNVKEEVQKILGKSEVKDEESGTELEQLTILESLKKKCSSSSINTKMNSYSSLSHSQPESENGIADLSGYDEKGVQVSGDYDENQISELMAADYPKGAALGTAVHEVFEKADFTECDDSEKMNSLIRRCFTENSYMISKEDDKNWCRQTLSFVQNTLKAKLPEIKGSKFTGNWFTLSKISRSRRLSEVEFNLNPEISKLMTDYCLGYIDLLFERDVSGQKIYSVLDWKTDTLINEDIKNPYGDGVFLEKHVSEHYAIQRVLYSYSLIKWLKQFYDKSEQQIFQENFGGIYYVLIRGCVEGTSNGIYAQTWKDWAELEAAFKNICEKLIRQE